MTTRFLTSFAVVALSAGMASAEGRMHGACREDIRKFCADVPHGGGRIAECLKTHASELSETCTTARAAMKDRVGRFEAACGKDVDAFCPNLTGDRLHDCLKTNKAKFSDTCHAFFAEEHHRFHGHGRMHGACRDDVKKFCSDVPHAGGRIGECLKAHQAELSEGCRTQATTMEAHRAEFKAKFDAACGKDVEAFCPGLKPGDGQLHQCLKTNKEKFSDTCRDFFHQFHQWHGQRQGPGPELQPEAK